MTEIIEDERWTAECDAAFVIALREEVQAADIFRDHHTESVRNDLDLEIHRRSILDPTGNSIEVLTLLIDDQGPEHAAIATTKFLQRVQPKPFERDLVDTLLSIEKCIEERRHMPTKFLLYSLMDSIAWACSNKAERSTRRNFESWVERWMMPRFASIAPRLQSVDLYAARCAVLHSMTPDSELSRASKAKKLAYAWGSGKVEVLEAVLDGLKVSNVVALHYDDLLDVLRNGIADCLAEADTDPALNRLLQAAAEQHYAYVNSGQYDGASVN